MLQRKIDLSRKNIRSINDHNYKSYALDSIEELDASQNQIKIIDNRLLSKLKVLTWLDLSNNQIAEINENCFNQMPRLSYLDLSNNRIEYISENLFNKCFQLVDLYLSNNKIKKLHKNVFYFCGKLEWVDLSNNLIIELNENIFNQCSKLVYLNISNNLVVDFTSLNKNLSEKCKNLKNKIDFVKNDYLHDFDMNSLYKKIIKLKIENETTIYFCQLLNEKINENQADRSSYSDC